MVPWNAKKSNEGSLEALRNLANDQERTLIILPKSSPTSFWTWPRMFKSELRWTVWILKPNQPPSFRDSSGTQKRPYKSYNHYHHWCARTWCDRWVCCKENLRGWCIWMDQAAEVLLGIETPQGWQEILYRQNLWLGYMVQLRICWKYWKTRYYPTYR